MLTSFPLSIPQVSILFSVLRCAKYRNFCINFAGTITVLNKYLEGLYIALNKEAGFVLLSMPGLLLKKNFLLIKI